MFTRSALTLALTVALLLSAAPAVAAVVDDRGPSLDVAALEADAVTVDASATYVLTAGEVAPVLVLGSSSAPMLASEPASWRPATARAVSPSNPGEPLRRGDRWRT